MELQKFRFRPNRKQIFEVWNWHKEHGDVPKLASFRKHGEVRQVWGGFVVCYNP